MSNWEERLNALSLLRTELHGLEQRQRELKEQRTLLKAALVESLEAHLRTLPLTEIAPWLHDFYWQEPDFAQVSLKVHARLLKGAFLPGPRPFEVLCSRCREPYLAECSSWTDLKQKRAGKFGHCVTCQPRQRSEFDSSAESVEQQREAYQDYLRGLSYAEYLQTEHWQGLRLQVLRRASYRCQLCYRDAPLDVHHRTYLRRGQEYLSDLIALCRNCHERHHEKGDDENAGGV